MKKLLLGLGASSLAVLPLVAVASCSSAETITLNRIDATSEDYTYDIKNINYIAVYTDSITKEINQMDIGVDTPTEDSWYLRKYFPDKYDIERFLKEFIAKEGETLIKHVEN